MRWLPLLAALIAAPASADEAPVVSTVREKLHARIMETLPSRPERSEGAAAPEAEPILVLEPIVVIESRGIRELEKQLAAEADRQRSEVFTWAKGGTIYRTGRMEIGLWGRLGTGWELLRIKW